jgi:hypothetical protein
VATGVRIARVRARSSRHQIISYTCSATHTAAKSVSATSAGTATATGKSNAKMIAATRRPRLSVRDTRTRSATDWALSIALIALPYYKDTNPALAASARHAIPEVLADHASTFR